MGLDVGFDRTQRFELKACVEKDPAACATIRANVLCGNLPQTLKIFEGDISTMSPLEILKATGLETIDVLVGGPPCQAFSTAGKRGGLQDIRGTMLWEYLRFVEVLSPKFFVMENVRGLLSADSGETFKTFIADLKKITPQYHIDCYVVNAVNYGAPQIRERILLIGNRYNTSINFPLPTHGPPQEDTLFDLFGGVEPLLPWNTLGKALANLKDSQPVKLEFSPRKLKYLELVPPGSNWRSLPVDIQKESMGKSWYIKGGRSGWWRRLSMDLPCPTLVTMPNHSSTSLCHPTETRALTLAEYARIQEFPDDWVFEGTASQKFAQVGNAVPVRLGQVVAETIVAAMDSLAANNWKSPTTQPPNFQVIHLQPHIRTRKWFHEGNAVIHGDD